MRILINAILIIGYMVFEFRIYFSEFYFKSSIESRRFAFKNYSLKTRISSEKKGIKCELVASQTYFPRGTTISTEILEKYSNKKLVFGSFLNRVKSR